MSLNEIPEQTPPPQPEERALVPSQSETDGPASSPAPTEFSFPASPTQLEAHVENRTEAPNGEPPLFQSWTQDQFIAPEVSRIPHMGHVLLLAVLVGLSLLCVSILTHFALRYRVFGISTAEEAISNVQYTLSSMGALYLLTFVASLLVFPLVWHKNLFAGLQWNGAAALRNRQKLLSTAAVCFVFAIINGILLPGPSDTPIDKIFRSPGAAWLLFAFGVTFAPFFEELVFRGFLLPAFSTAYDWMDERFTGKLTLQPDENGHPRWSFPAMVSASILSSLLFSLMHAEQTGKSLGPFLMLIAVSLVLCWVRLSTRSLAASILVHACYNFMLFTLMLIGTEGFQHLNKM
jgi:membrane protease YdiL (CAAX protease family)